jgi:DUF438 domain-containing protein
MQLSPSTKINDLLADQPFLEEFLVDYNPHFRLLRNKVTRATVGRLATLGTVARIAALDVKTLLQDLAAAIEQKTAVKPTLSLNEATGRDQRVAMLGQIIAHLHDGGDVATARQQFAEAVGDADASEIAAMEEEMIRGGLPVSEVQRLCDVHVDAFRGTLDQKKDLDPAPGHPIHTFIADNKLIVTLANTLSELARGLGTRPDDLRAMAEVLAKYDGIDNHYQRKEHQLFPLLERHGVMGPTQVMWGVHDQIRKQWKDLRAAVESGDAAAAAALVPALARQLVEMVYKEEKILFPLAMEKLSDEEWAEEQRGEEELGYGLAKPAVPASRPTVRLPLVHGRPPAPAPVAPTAGLLDLRTGALSLEVVDLLLRHLPLDISFVDENDVVRYYSDAKERIFPRSPGAIGRTVQNCHPPKSVATVNQILDSFRKGSKDVAEFWIEMGTRFVHIRYFAIRDDGGKYRGCLEVTQDVAPIRALQGQRRLLDWKD